MYTLRRWWDRHGLRMGLVCLALGSAWVLRQTQGAAVFEIYQQVSRPFESMPASADRIESAETQELQQRLAELESQNQQLQEMLGYVQSRPTEGITAPVIGRSADHWWQQVTLGRGSRDGIEVGGIVAGPGGLVGRITHITPSTSRVLLVSDPTSQVGVTISRSRHMGYMRGQAANRAVMEFFDKVPDVQPGDVVSTSSFSQLFPPGFPIGRVESVNLSKSPAPEAVIELSAPIHALEWVVVYPNSRTEVPGSP
ncbi:rod shape-determining protein MreC [Oculatella sp. FACHB-28]|uniref:rod shape-determining protein MreC n=1 Tax=Cyanophyceae TaxID=3028117 RepID=UPI0016873CB8|nr:MULTISPECIES: rod shape-determining protein MreC [Cyanophyceae]MBD1998236.1 rod shape-determining protein MreC [Leptolyngbya sp. FACHB-541]MBD2057103.1 rod shape-determining protein MreC [Oculatella sp. FACHB-28]